MFLKRVLTVVVILPLFAAALLFLSQWLWALLLLPGLYIAAWEWGALAGYTGGRRAGYAVITAASALAIFYATFTGAARGGAPELWTYILSCAFWVAVAPFWLAARWKIRNPLVLGIVGWIVLVPMWLALVRLQAQPYVLLMFMAVVWIADTAAYLAGKQWGRHKLAPLISPGKSWEGVAGAAAALGIYYVVLWVLIAPGERVFSAAFGIALFAALLVLSIEGDLFESWMKRQAGVKDSGQLLPGHGGLLDRIDGLTSTMPAAALALYLQ
jgi:phosphatidate cytidylyltransferase